MELIEAILKRRSVRNFTEQQIPEDFIEIMKTAIKFAPSAGNKQSRFFHFIFNNEIKQKLGEAAFRQKFIAQAPLVIVASMNLQNAESYKERGKTLYAIIDVAASVQNLMLTASSVGLGTCWIGAFDEEKVAQILELPKHLRPISLIPVGYPIVQPKPPKHLTDPEIFTIIQ